MQSCFVSAMQQSTKIFRPATAAIAVALVGTAAPVWAQDTTVAPPPVVTTAPAPTLAAPAAPAVVAPPPIARTVAPAAATETAASRTTINAEEVAQAEAERPAARAAQPASVRPGSTKVRAAPVERVAAAAPASVERSADTAPAAPAIAPPASDAAAMAAATAPSEPAVAENSGTNGGIPISWLLGGLGALALLGVAAAVMMRRRSEAEYQEVHAHPALAEAPDEPVVSRPAAVTAAGPVLAAGPVRALDGRMMGRHEALAMEGPSADNPFLTRKNRLKRARFHDRQERIVGAAQRPASPFDPRPVAAAAVRPARDTGVVRANVRAARQSAFGWPGAAKPAMG